MPTLPACRRHDMPDAAWLVLEFVLAAVLPPAKGPGRPRKWPLRLLIDGIRWRVRAGAPWRDLPAEYGPWQSAYGLFRRWQVDGTWAAVVTALQALADAAGHVTWDVSVDSGTARAHQHAAGARKDGAAQKEPPGPEPSDHALGRSRGGLTTKFHLAAEQGQKPLAVIVTAGQRGDSPQFIPVLDKIRVPRPARRPAPHPAGPRPGRQGIRIPREPRVPAAPQDPLHYPRAEGPGRRPEAERQLRRQALGLRPGERTSSGTPWNAPSTGSSATVPSLPGTTSSPSATKPPSTSPRSANGSGPSLLKQALVGGLSEGGGDAGRDVAEPHSWPASLHRPDEREGGVDLGDVLRITGYDGMPPVAGAQGDAHVHHVCRASRRAGGADAERRAWRRGGPRTSP